MMRRIPRFILAASAVAGLATLTTLGCSNGWLDSKERQSTPAALMFDAQKAYDAEEFTEAARLYALAVKKDPANVQARVGLSFAYNGQAGLSLTGLVGRAIENGMGKSSSSTNLAEATPTSATSDIAKIAAIVGLNSTEMSAITAEPKALIDATELRKISLKFEKLHQSWLAICPVLPKAAIDILKAEGATVVGLLDVSKCKSGIAQNNGAAMFAAMIGVLAQSASLYQLLDTDSNGSPDVIDKITTGFTSIENRQTTVNSATDLNAINTEVKGLATDMAALTVEVKKIDESQIIPLALANMQVLKSLLNSMQSIPDNVKNTINKTLDKLDSAKTKLDEYKSKIAGLNSSTGTASKGTEITKKAAAAAAQADNMLGKQVAKIVTEEDQKAYDANKTQVCTNFDSLAVTAGLPVGSEKPCGCNTDDAAKNLCCHKKNTGGSTGFTNMQTCCEGAYGSNTLATTCINVGTPTYAALVGDSFAAFLAETASEQVVESNNANLTEDEALHTLMEMAWKAWRE